MIESKLIEPTYSLLKRTQVVYRANVNGNRVYYTLDADNTPNFRISLTTMIRATCPKPEQLIKWIADQGYEESKRYMEERASYGSLLHYLIGKLITDKKFDFDFTHQICADIAAFEKWQYKDHWASDLNDDIAAFMQFVIDYKVHPLAVELVLVSEKDGYGTAIDLVCEMTIQEDGFDENDPYKSGARKGQPREVKVDKKITALMNFKSRRTGSFYEDEEVQLEFEKRLFNENYPEIHIDKIYNWSPKEWRGITPTYALKDQSDSLNIGKANAILEIARIELFKKMPVQTIVSGNVKFGEMPKIEYVSVEEIIRNKHSEIEQISLANTNENN